MIKQQASEDQTAVAQSMWKVSISPHIKSSESVEKIMWTVVACLVPPLLLSVFVFGIQVLFITAVSVVSCVVVEAISQKASDLFGIDTPCRIYASILNESQKTLCQIPMKADVKDLESMPFRSPLCD